MIIYNCAKTGLDFNALNHLSMATFLDYVDFYAKLSDTSQSKGMSLDEFRKQKGGGFR